MSIIQIAGVGVVVTTLAIRAEHAKRVVGACLSPIELDFFGGNFASNGVFDGVGVVVVFDGFEVVVEE